MVKLLAGATRKVHAPRIRLINLLKISHVIVSNWTAHNNFTTLIYSSRTFFFLSFKWIQTLLGMILNQHWYSNIRVWVNLHLIFKIAFFVVVVGVVHKYSMTNTNEIIWQIGRCFCFVYSALYILLHSKKELQTLNWSIILAKRVDHSPRKVIILSHTRFICVCFPLWYGHYIGW